MKINIKRNLKMGVGGVLAAILATQSVCSPVVQAATQTQSVFIPAYTYPKRWSGGDNSYWKSIIAAGGQKVPFVVVNPNSGTGDKVNPDYQEQIKDIENAGIKYIGYVKHARQTRPIQEVADEIDRWYQMYPGISGMFFDETDNHNDAAKTCYIANISNYIKVKHPGAIVVHNPGTRMYDDNILPYGDVFMTVEAMADDYINDPYYSTNHEDARDFEKNPDNAKKIWHVIYDIDSQEQQDKVLQLSRERNAGWVFATSDKFAGGAGNPYDNLSKYFNNYTNVTNTQPATPLTASAPTPLPAGCEDKFNLNVTGGASSDNAADNSQNSDSNDKPDDGQAANITDGNNQPNKDTSQSSQNSQNNTQQRQGLAALFTAFIKKLFAQWFTK